MAAEMGFKIATRGAIRLRLNKHRFHGFGNAVAFYFRRAVFRHDAYDEAADYRNDDHQPAEVVMLGAREICRPAMKKKRFVKRPINL